MSLPHGDGSGGGGSGGYGKAISVAAALDAYEANLRIRGGDTAIVRRVRLHLPARLLDKAVALLTPRELRHFRDTLAKKGAAGTADRIGNGLRAALNLAANTYFHIVSRQAWDIGLREMHNATELAGRHSSCGSGAAAGRIILHGQPAIWSAGRGRRHHGRPRGQSGGASGGTGSAGRSLASHDAKLEEGERAEEGLAPAGADP